MKGRAVVLFSGGSDCTLAAAKAAQSGRFEEIILLTYEVPVSCLDANAGRNVPRLRTAFPGVRFTHAMMPAGPVIEKILAKKRLRSLVRHGLMEASLCLHCRMGMHVRTVMYCLDNDVAHVLDGSNVTMALWVDQTRKGLEMIDQLYRAFGITLEHPVVDYVGDDLFDLVKYLSPEELDGVIHKSTSQELHEMNVLGDGGHKSDYATSYRAQPVCLGVVMSLIHSLGYRLPFEPYPQFQRRALAWLRDKVEISTEMLTEYRNERRGSELGRLI